MKVLVNNQPFLDQFISKESFNHPPARVALYSQKNNIGWFTKIQVLLKSDRETQRKIETAYLIIALLLLVGSYMLGVTFLIVNSIFFRKIFHGTNSD